MNSGQSWAVEAATVMLSEPCPRCGKIATVTGHIATSGYSVDFQPDGIRLLEHFRRRLFQTTYVKLDGLARACLECGLVWTTALSLGNLRSVVEREGITIGLKAEEPEI